jgi:GDP-4-dehydro-6-deoxy-D-mannose reductase
MAVAEPRRILITGWSGFVGRHLLPLLDASFPGVKIFTNSIDVANRDAVIQAVRDAEPDACIHLAAISSVPAAKRDPESTWRVNLHGTLNIAQAVLEHAPGCQLLFASSAEIYGGSFREGHPLNESALLAPMNSYAATKAAADLALGSMASEGLRVVRLRLFNHTGPGQSEAFVLPAFARQIARIEAGHQLPCIHVGALDSWRDFLDVRDVCRAYIACLRLAPELMPGALVNIASGIPRKIGDIFDELMDLAGVHPEIVIDGARLRSSEIVSATGDAAGARQLLGWTPKILWAQTLADILADWRKRTVDHSTGSDAPRP